MATHMLGPTPATVHWGYLDAKVPPRLTVDSGDTVTIDTVSGGLADVGDTAPPRNLREAEAFARSAYPDRSGRGAGRGAGPYA